VKVEDVHGRLVFFFSVGFCMFALVCCIFLWLDTLLTSELPLQRVEVRLRVRLQALHRTRRLLRSTQQPFLQFLHFSFTYVNIKRDAQLNWARMGL
jgi:hypothetical protein